jgi:hypothetical protein
MKRLYLLAALALSALPCVAFAQACTAISALPATITQPGKYCLAKDFVVNQATGNAISIASNDVTLDCGGRTLKNTATSNTVTSVAISSIGRNNVVVEHCRVIGGWMNGIDVFQDNAQPNKNYYVEVRDNYVAGPWWHGIRAWGSAIEVTNNKVYDIGGRLNQYAIGIRVGGSTSGFRMHVVRGNIVIGTNSPYSHAYGIFSDGSMSSAFLDNGVAGTSAATGKNAYGVYVIGTYNRVTDNHVTGVGSPTETGIWATDSTTSCFDNYLRAVTGTMGCDSTMGNY